jgi:hypothetical protein
MHANLVQIESLISIPSGHIYEGLRNHNIYMFLSKVLGIYITLNFTRYIQDHLEATREHTEQFKLGDMIRLIRINPLMFICYHHEHFMFPPVQSPWIS